MLEKLLSDSDVEEKKRALTEKYGMIMTIELEGRMHTMCNWSEAIKEMSYDEGKEDGIKEGIAALIAICRQYRIPDKEILQNLMEKFTLSEKEAEEYLVNVKQV